jgi:hypothetical protein
MEAGMRVRVAVPLAVALLLVAALLAGLAHQVGAWHDVMRGDDVRFVTAPVDQGLWGPPAGPGAGVAQDLLGLSDDVRFRKAERLYVRGHLPATTFAQEKARLAARGGATELLEQTMNGDSEPWRRARAANLLGILLVEDAREGRELAPALSRQAVRAFSTGARQADGADEPRFNLEILLTQLRPNGLVGRDLSQDQTGLANGFGAGLAIPEKGY